MTRALPIEFESVLDLARLDWFDVTRGNALTLEERAADEIGPIIDMQTHLALGFFRQHHIDLDSLTATTAYYLPVTSPVDLDAYSNKNFDPSALFAMKLDVSALGLSSSGMRTTHTAPNLLRDMDRLGIDRSVILPFDLPIGARNADRFLDVASRYERLISFGSVHPRDRDIDRRMDSQVKRGAKGIKLHPNGQFLSPDDDRVVHLCGCCGNRGLPVLFHCGPVGIEPKAAERRSQVARYERAIAENPSTTFILGHSGALQHREAITFAARYPNTYFELSCLGLSALREVIEAVPMDRLLYGTDWPFYHQALTLTRVLIATEDAPDLRRAILFDNANCLLA